MHVLNSSRLISTQLHNRPMYVLLAMGGVCVLVLLAMGGVFILLFTGVCFFVFFPAGYRWCISFP